jgi:hypothetical protein
MDFLTPICNNLRELGLNAKHRGTAALLHCAACAAELDRAGDEWNAMGCIQAYAERNHTTQGKVFYNIRRALRSAGVPMTPAQAIGVLALEAQITAPERGYCRLHCCEVEEVGSAERLHCEESRCRDCDWLEKGDSE